MGLVPLAQRLVQFEVGIQFPSAAVSMSYIHHARATHSLISTLQPVASAPASMQLRTLAMSWFSPLSVGLRACQNALVDEGTILATLGVSKKAQWIRCSGWSCCRRTDTLLYEATSASRALTPSHGFPPACALLPVNSQNSFFRAFIMVPAMPSVLTSGKRRPEHAWLVCQLIRQCM